MIRNFFLKTITFYQWFISPLFPPSCRFYPTCSEYAKEAVISKGMFLGIWLTFKRLLRCHPFGGQGYDPVPEDKNLEDK